MSSKAYELAQIAQNLVVNASGTITDLEIDTTNIDSLVNIDLAIAPEVLEIQVDAPAAGQDTAWLWTWEQSTLPYARRTITNSPEVSVPLYRQGQYVVNNFAAYDIHGSMTQTHTLYFKWIDSAGTDNLISWATSSGPISDTHPDINGGAATDVQRITVNVPATITPPTLTAPSVSYTVTNNGSGAYTFSGSAAGDNPNIGPLYKGGTYTFNVNASGHPFYLTTDNGSNFSAGTYFGEYTSGVTGSRTDSGTVTFTVPSNAPDTLYYQCGNHSAMRGAITVKDLAVETNINGNYVVYAMHTQEGHKTPIELRPIPSLVNQMCIVYDASVGKFVPQDLATYVENTPSFENKIREVAGTAELVVEDGSAVVAKVNVYDDSTYLPLTGNNAGDQAFATDTNILYIWDGSAWQQAGTTNTDDLTEGSTNLFYTNERVDDRVAALVIGGNNITATYDDAAGTLTIDGQPGYTDTDVGNYLSSNGYDTATNIIATITDSAPATLDTLNELAAALGDDPNFATTTANNIALKAPIASPTFTGTATTDVLVSQLHLQETSIPTGTTYTIPSDKQMIVESLDIIGDLDVQGTLATVSGGSLSQNTMKTQAIAHTNGTNVMNITSDGKVGIGTTSPDRALHIEGSDFSGSSIRLKRTSGGTNNDAGLQFQSAAGANADTGMGGIWFQNSLDGNAYALIRARTDDASGTSGRLEFMTDNTAVNNFTSPSLTIKSSGSIGIGTSTPENVLHVTTSAAGGPQIELESTSGTANSAFINFDGTSLQMSTQRDMVDGSKRDTGKSWGGINIIGQAAGSSISMTTSEGNNNAATTRWTLSKEGYITTPYMPAFDASRPANTSGAHTGWNNVWVNRGNHFNQSSGRFTAPVDGVYTFYFTGIKNNQAGTTVRLYLEKNGTQLYNSRHLRLDGGGTSPYGDNGTMQWTVTLSAGDYVMAATNAGNVYNSTDEYTVFGGYLIG